MVATMKFVNGISTVSHASTSIEHTAWKMWEWEEVCVRMGFLLKKSSYSEWFGWNISNKNMLGCGSKMSLVNVYNLLFVVCSMCGSSHIYIVNIEMHKRGIWFLRLNVKDTFPLRTFYYHIPTYMCVCDSLVFTSHPDICECFSPLYLCPSGYCDTTNYWSNLATESNTDKYWKMHDKWHLLALKSEQRMTFVHDSAEKSWKFLETEKKAVRFQYVRIHFLSIWLVIRFSMHLHPVFSGELCNPLCFNELLLLSITLSLFVLLSSHCE